LSSVDASTETKRFRSNLINLSGGFEEPVVWRKEMPDEWILPILTYMRSYKKKQEIVKEKPTLTQFKAN